ncbi:MAG: PilN domain-containing protein [Nitrospirae bacterium]|nr:PilN domain-containing protein [Nitrospirota bacterium]
MIRINLLPTDKKPRKKKKTAQKIPSIVLGIIATFVVSLLASGVGIYLLDKQIKTLKKDKAHKTAKYEELKKQVKDAKEIEDKIKTIEANKKVIEELRANMSVPVKVIDEISKLLPENVWLKSMSLNGPSISIDGVAMTNDDVVVFVNNFKNSKVFKETYLVKSIEVQEKGENVAVRVYNFAITMIVNPVDTGVKS